MPYASPKQCNRPGCYTIISGTHKYCKAHTTTYKRVYDDGNRFYTSARWLKKRTVYLQQHPLCVECLKDGRVVPAKDIDHLVPIKQGGAMLADDNLQALCKYHHGIKTYKENKKNK